MIYVSQHNTQMNLTTVDRLSTIAEWETSDFILCASNFKASGIESLIFTPKQFKKLKSLSLLQLNNINILLTNGPPPSIIENYSNDYGKFSLVAISVGASYFFWRLHSRL
jgi:hypothetical protein